MADGGEKVVQDARAPAWTRGEIEAPAGEKEEDGAVLGVYTEEQQKRLNVNEWGESVEPEPKETQPALYTYWRSSCSWRVRIALNWKGIDFTSHPIHLVKDGGQQLADEYKTKNPMAEVPALEIDGILLTQSMAIIEYLEESRPERPLLPKDLIERAKVRQIVQIIASGIQPVQNLRVLRKHGMEHKVEWGQWAINHGFEALEKQLKLTAGKYSCGDDVTMADLCLVPQVYNANRFKIDMTKYPTIAKVNAALEALPEFEKATPSKQPDAQPE